MSHATKSESLTEIPFAILVGIFNTCNLEGDDIQVLLILMYLNSECLVFALWENMRFALVGLLIEYFLELPKTLQDVHMYLFKSCVR